MKSVVPQGSINRKISEDDVGRPFRGIQLKKLPRIYPRRGLREQKRRPATCERGVYGLGRCSSFGKS